MAASKAAISALAERSIHIKIHPVARDIAERREVVRVLERFGEVDMFRSLKYDDSSTSVPNAFLSILATPEAARRAIAASPIRYRLVSNVSPSSTSSTSSTSSSNLDTTTPSTNPNQPTPPTPQTFELRISPSQHPHHHSVRASPLHASYTPISTRRSPIAADLAARIPSSIHKPGLCDWVSDSPARADVPRTTVPWRLARRKPAAAAAAAAASSRSTTHQIALPSVLRGLRNYPVMGDGDVARERKTEVR
ncbi:MAG: hypothetical protein M1818_004116 [Claussenomyces sp. TS43310]|nr:MAG: hypothetical protein M1818_004116 [Claussenomyces sp. TS43310]